MRKKRILPHIAALAAALCMTVLPSGLGAVPDMTVDAGAETEINGIGATKNTVRQGESFDVIVNVPQMNAYADTVEIRLGFDPDVFELTSWEPQIASGTSMKNSDTQKGFAIVVAANANVNLSYGLTVTAGFRAKSTAALGNSAISLKRADVSNTETGFSWTPSTRDVQIKVADNLAPVSGKISLNLPTSASETAQISLTGSDGSLFEQSVTLNRNITTGKLEGTYLFSNTEGGVTYTMKIDVAGWKPRIETVGTDYGNTDADLSLNLLGDVDGNGDRSAADATLILKYIVGLPSSINDDYTRSVACVEGGTKPTERDATQILRYLAFYPSVFNPNP